MYILVYTYIMWIYQVIDHLNEAGVRYALAGGYAVSLNGAVRGTVDLDIVISLSESNLMRAEKALKQLGLQSRIPVSAQDIFKFREEYIKERNLIAWSFVDFKNFHRVVDIVITYNLNSLKMKTMHIDGHKVNVLDIPSLIKMKTAANRPQDIEDIKALKEIYEKKL